MGVRLTRNSTARWVSLRRCPGRILPLRMASVMSSTTFTLRLEVDRGVNIFVRGISPTVYRILRIVNSS